MKNNLLSDMSVKKGGIIINRKVLIDRVTLTVLGLKIWGNKLIPKNCFAPYVPQTSGSNIAPLSNYEEKFLKTFFL